MQREFHRWYSGSLGREMEMLSFAARGHPRGVPVLAFPTSCNRFYEYEDRGMVWALREQIEAGHLQLFCVDGVDAESWYNRHVPPSWRIARHAQYERYLLGEVLPLLQQRGGGSPAVAIGCSMGAYHAANLVFRRPDLFTGLLAMSGIFDPTGFLDGYHDSEVYFHSPALYLRHLADPWHFEHFHRSKYILAVGEHDICRGANEEMARLMQSRNIPCRFDIWGDGAVHDWPVWLRMAEHYL